MSKRTLQGCAACLIALTFWGISLTPATSAAEGVHDYPALQPQAIPVQQTRSGYVGGDVIFLVDQSGSMGGRSFGSTNSNPATDPDNLRFEAVEFGVDWVGNFRALQASLGNRLDLRVGAVYFGGDGDAIGRNFITEVPLPLTDIQAETLQEWQNERQDLIYNVSLEAFGFRNLGNTDFISGVERALDEISIGSEDRLQLIVVLTDGAPCAPFRFTDINCTTDSDRVDHMNDLNDLVRRRFSALNQRIYTLALDANNTYWTRFADLWQVVTDSHAARLENPIEMGVRLNDILEDYLSMLEQHDGEVTREAPPVRHVSGMQTDLPISDGMISYDVPAYQQLMMVTLFKSQNTSHLTAGDPIGNPVTARTEGVSVTGENTFIETWYIAHPAPGRWTFGSVRDDSAQYADPNADLRMTFVRALFDFSQPLAQQQQYLPYDYVVQVTDSQNQPLNFYSDSRYQLVGDVTVTLPDSSTLVLPITPGDQPGEYRAQLTPFAEGSYRASVVAYIGNSATAPIYSSTLADDVRVVPSGVQLQGLSARVLENIPQVYHLQFVRGDGTPLSEIDVSRFVMALLPSGTDDCTSMIPQGDYNPQTVTLIEGAEVFYGSLIDDQWTIEAVHHAIGEHLLCVRADIRDGADAAQTARTVYYGSYGRPINVIPLQPLDFVVTINNQAVEAATISIPEESRTEVPLLEGLEWLPLKRPVWAEQPIQVSVRVIDKVTSSTLFPLQTLLSDEESSNVFELSILNDQNANVIPDSLLSASDNAAIWQAALEDLPVGTYTVIVRTQSRQFGEDRAFLPEDTTISFPLIITPNYEKQTLYTMSAVIGAGVLVGLITFGLVLPVLGRINPIQGTLILYRRPVSQTRGRAAAFATIELQARRRNRYRVPLTQLPLIDPPMTELSVRSVRSSLKVTYGINGKINETDVSDQESVHIFPYKGEDFLLRWERGSRKDETTN